MILVGASTTALAEYGAAVVWCATTETPAVVAATRARVGTSLAVSDLSARQLQILLQVEDPNFYGHHGLDWSTPGAGLTTITQADVKLMYFEKFEPGVAKLRQSLIARFVLDRLVSKDAQLELFINGVYMGDVGSVEVRGFEAAARIYFRIPFRSLDEEQYITLVAMIIAPNAYSIRSAPERNAERGRRIRRLVAGSCTPSGWLDVELDGCR
jgi:membrane peptidoglycan carboxypeptidase